MSMISSMSSALEEMITTIKMLDKNSNIKFVENGWEFEIIDENNEKHIFQFDGEDFVFATKLLINIIQRKINGI